METIRIDLERLSDADINQIIRIVNSNSSPADLATEKSVAVITTPFIDVVQAIAIRLITSAIEFTYIPR